MKKFKRTKFWKLFLLVIVIPIYDFFWKYFLNSYGKFLHILWNLRKRKFFDLKKDNNILVKDSEFFCNLANEISNFCNYELIQNSRNVIYEGTNDVKNFADKKGEKYQNGIFEFLPENLKKKIINFASSDLMITTASKYFGVFPILTRIYLYHNIPIINSNERSAQLWHKDGFGYKGFDLFISITDVNELNGPLYFLKKKNKLGVFERIENSIKNPRKGERNKITLENFDKIYSNNNISNNIGQRGTALFIDSYNCYHRGGFCKKTDRIMLRIAYDTIDSVVTNSSERFKEDLNNGVNYYFFENGKKRKFSNIFLRYLFLKKSYLFHKFKIAEKLLSFYQFMHHKII